jgi:hypothetical protein
MSAGCEIYRSGFQQFSHAGLPGGKPESAGNWIRGKEEVPSAYRFGFPASSGTTMSSTALPLEISVLKVYVGKSGGGNSPVPNGP